ncbi:MAG: nucleotidyltransferase domain-containing protein [Defluviitaleaceae bacterium]|nr:nucleotidyltransferase domain-containing protein [Defluviitaleaceae bacterium]
MQEIITHITNSYTPLCILIYGSYADGTYNAHSDFDCAIIVASKSISHDTSFVAEMQLDLFIHTLDEVSNITDYADFAHLHDAIIIKDYNNVAMRLKNGAADHVLNNSAKTDQEKESLKSWLVKMLKRSENRDTEGLFRYHWLLTDSLEIYFSLRDKFYFGPKKSIKYLEDTDISAYNLYGEALKSMEHRLLKDWIDYVIAV